MNTLRAPLPTASTAQASMISAQTWVALQFDAAIQSAADASDALSAEASRLASAHAWRAASVVQSLQQTLDMERGGELARHLFELFDYVQRRLRVSVQQEPARAYREAESLLSQVRQAWQTEPELVPTCSRTPLGRVH